MASQASHAEPNVLRSAALPNTLAGMGLPGAVVQPRRPLRPYIATTGVVLAVLAIVLLMWRG